MRSMGSGRSGRLFCARHLKNFHILRIIQTEDSNNKLINRVEKTIIDLKRERENLLMIAVRERRAEQPRR